MNKEYLEKFFYDIGLDKISEEKKEQYFANILETLENRIESRIKNHLSENEIREWESLSNDADLEKFHTEHKIDISAISMEEAQVYREQLIKSVAYLNAKGK